jgi:hypothetical protein
MTAGFNSVAMQRSQNTDTGNGKPLEWAFERFLAVADGADEGEAAEEWYLPAPVTPARRSTPDVPSAPKKAAPVSLRGGATPRSCRALQDITGVSSVRRSSLPDVDEPVYGSWSQRRASDGSPSEEPLVFEFVLDVPRGEGGIVTLSERGTSRGEKKRGLPKRMGLPTSWIEGGL